jgi:N-hydroxyarylamine O-acetyltransferase
MNLSAYLQRIGFAGEPDVSLATLQRIVLRHICSIPFENLDVLLNRGISLEDDTIEQKLVHNRRGGYCFEQNSLLLRALQAIGFSATPLSARVRLKAPRDFVPPRTHLFVRVDLDGIPWMVDCGIGSLAPTAPIRLDLLDAEQPSTHEARRIVRDERLPSPHYFHQAKLADEWADVNEFTLEEMPRIDREIGNWWTSTNPGSKFRQNLMVALARPDGTRLSILNHEFTHRRGAEILERFEIADGDQLLEVLSDRFGLVFPKETRFEVNVV